MTKNDQPTISNTPLLERNRHPMEAILKEKRGASLALKTGDLVDGHILEKRGSRIFIDLGGRGTGIIYGREFYEAQHLIKTFNQGDEISAKIIDLDNEEGFIELSIQEAGREKNWQEMRRAMENGELITLRAHDANRGGLIIEYRGVSGFLPASQLSAEHYPRVEGGDKKKIFDELRKLLGQDLQVKIIDMDAQEGKLIFSEKSKHEGTLKAIIEKYHVGDIIEGEISGVVPFGAFVHFGEGLEGLVHISEIDWQLIENPADVLTAGEKVQVKIIDIAGDKISLSLKALKDDPWVHVPTRYKKGDMVDGLVVKYNPFGAFVKLDDEIQGLAHISEFGTEAKMKERLPLHQNSQFKVLSVDAKEHRLALGLPERHPAREHEETPRQNQPFLEQRSPETPEEQGDTRSSMQDMDASIPSVIEDSGENDAFEKLNR